jgi:hypothetical protein
VSFIQFKLSFKLTTYYRLRALAAEVTRVTLEVGSQGKLGGRAHVSGVEGVWFELVRNVSCLIFPLFRLNLTWAILGKPDVLFFYGSSMVYSSGYHLLRKGI